ncbi:lysophospholipase, putative [Plasmodium vinckei brucechwatti]|uniref:Lysophospholipase, putative n=1 Tax=Plasmodium vinckei brucechwatti TaxID=119398 RepID=A0A6V7S7Z7_PLAVN|nr:lysophospholipase, putative [Plasmodium vinckei brucechwatti]
MEEIELSNDELRNTTCKLDGDPKVGWFRNKNGLLIKTYGWLVQNAIGIILLIHGFRSHARLTYMKINLKMPNGSEDLVVDNDNYYIYKDSWIEKFNQHGYSVYTLDLQGHGESQSLGNLRGDINCFDDLVDDVIQYINQIHDEIPNDDQTNDEITNDNQTNYEISNDDQTNYDISSDNQTNYDISNDDQTNYDISSDNQTNYEISNDNQTNYEISNDDQTNYDISSDNQTNYDISNDDQTNYDISSDNQTNYEIPNDDQTNDEIPNDDQTDDEISNDNQTDDESHDIITTKKKRLPMYIIGHSMGGNIALRILQLLGKEKENSINAENENNYKNFNIILDNYINASEIDNDMEEDMIDDMYDMNNFNKFVMENMNNIYFLANSNGYYFDKSCFSASDTSDSIVSDKYEGCYNYLDKLNIKGCASLSGMMRLQAPLDGGSKSFKYLYLPIIKFLSIVAPHALISSELGYKRSEYVTNICKYDKFRNKNGVKFKCISELIKATITLDCNINYLPKEIPLLFVHSIDDCVCNYKGSAMFYDKAKVNRKELYIVEGMNHSITTAPENEKILKMVIDWICDLERNDEEEIKDEIDDGIEGEIKYEVEDEKNDDIENEMEGEIEDEIKYEIDDEKELHIVDDMSHDITKDLENEHVLKKIIGWIRNLIRNDEEEIKDEIDDRIEGEMDGEIENEMEGEIKYEVEDEKNDDIENEMEGEIKHEKEDEKNDDIENEMEGEIKHEKEDEKNDDIENEMEGEIKHEKEDEKDDEIENVR